MALRTLGTFLLLLSSSLTILSSAASSFELEPLPGSRRRLLQNDMIQQFLVPHNRVRAGLGLPPLQWSATLANYAAWWANQRRRDCAMIHTNSNYGENIFWGSGRNWQASDAVGAWAAEGRYYNYGSNSCQPNWDCSHYTQVVWRQSSRVGCARVVCNDGDTFITCNYDPHGNIMGQKPF